MTWTKERYEQSVSSRCWSWTPYGDGWDNCLKRGGDLQGDAELREIVAMEAALGEVPAWATQVVRGPINCVAPCGHLTFPRSYIDALQAIGSGYCRPVHHTCYTVDRRHKFRLQDLALLLDAWLAGAQADDVAIEVQAREGEGWDWPLICRGLWKALGDRTELKDLLVERFLHQLRWWVKVTVWEDDLDGGWGRDQYLGAWLPADDLITGNGNRQLGTLPGMRQAASPRVQRWEARLAELCLDWRFFRTVIGDFSWPCGPKAFRYYEKLLWCIGRERQVIALPDFPLADPEPVPTFLGPLAAPPDFAAATAWWDAFLAALDAWWREAPRPDGAVAALVTRALGDATPVKRWLVRLYAHRLRLLVVHSGILDKLVAAPALKEER